jgi:cysteine desulfurase
MIPYYLEHYANPSSSHKFGESAKREVENTRIKISEILNCRPDEIYFTSGATESLNLAILGYCIENISDGDHIITVKTEHHAVLDTFNYLSTNGFDVDFLEVNNDGLIDIRDLEKKLRNSTLIVSVMHVNNETGVIQPVEIISSLLRERKIAFLSDLTQSAGKSELNFLLTKPDLAAFSAHKFHGPKGIGVLYVKKGIKLNPQSYGGGQERKLRNGTINSAGIIGLGKALEIAYENRHENSDKTFELKKILENELLKIEGAEINGHLRKRACNITNICFKNHDVTKILLGADNLMVSNGSACTSSVIEPSHVLRAMGLSDDDCNSSIRFSLSKYNSEQEIYSAIKIIKKTIKA